MQQWSGNMAMQNGGEDAVFEFPQEVLAILPSDPYEHDYRHGCCVHDYRHGCCGVCVQAGIGDREFAPEVG